VVRRRVLVLKPSELLLHMVVVAAQTALNGICRYCPESAMYAMYRLNPRHVYGRLLHMRPFLICR
jgi:hypothetical protein